MATMLGVRRASVTAVAQELQALGLIRYTRGQVTIVDEAGLQSVACICAEENHARLPNEA